MYMPGSHFLPESVISYIGRTEATRTWEYHRMDERSHVRLRRKIYTVLTHAPGRGVVLRSVRPRHAEEVIQL